MNNVWKMKRSSLEQGALVTPSAKLPGRIQITFFDRMGFSGDTDRKTEREVRQLLKFEGYVPADREFFESVSSGEGWDRGMEGVLEVQRFNAGIQGD